MSDGVYNFNPRNAYGIDAPKEYRKILDAESAYYKKLREERARNGGFDFSECAENYLDGAAKMVKDSCVFVWENPGTAAAAAAACFIWPPLIPLLAYGALGYGAYETADAAIGIAKDLYNGDYDSAEKGFSGLGEGSAKIAGAMLSMKGAAKTAKEIKAMHELGVRTLTAAQKAEIAAQVNGGSIIDAVKEINSLFTSKQGIQASAACFKPSAALQRVKDAANYAANKILPKVKKERVNFSETEEGKRLAAMTADEIQDEAAKLIQEEFDEYGTPEKLRPKVTVNNNNTDLAGAYMSDKHEITINEQMYKAGVYDSYAITGHEAKHADLAVLRERLPMQEKQTIAAEHLLSKIQNGEYGSAPSGILNGFYKTGPAPKLTGRIKTDFMKLAQSELYKEVIYTPDELTAMVKPLIDANPDFAAGYKSADEALQALMQYAKSHNFRYNLAMQYSSGFNTSGIDRALIEPLSDVEKPAAVQAFKNGIDLIEANAARNPQIPLTNIKYLADNEETLAEMNGMKFAISKYQKELAALRGSGAANPAAEAYLLDKIKTAESVITYRERMHAIGELMQQLVQNPDDKTLKLKLLVKTVQTGVFPFLPKPDGRLSEAEIITEIAKQGKPLTEIITEIQKAYKYTLREMPDTGASMQIPYLAPAAFSEMTSDKQ